MSKFLALLALVLVVGCGSNIKVPNGTLPSVSSPFLIKIDPKDYGRFNEIKQSPIEDRFKKQIAYLQAHNHDLQWFPNALGKVTKHETVQLVYFDYSNYVVGFCSGAFVSDNFIASAGHCNTAVYSLQSEGASCEANLLFAYKPAPEAKLEYHRCDKVVAHANDSSRIPQDQGAKATADQYSKLDYTLFRLANAAGHPVMRDSFLESRAHFLKNYQTVPTNILLGLVVDPPTDSSKSFLSSYDVVLSEVVDNEKASKDNNLTRYDAIVAKALYNSAQRGNSGGPFYLLSDNPLKTKGDKNEIVAFRTYVAPISGIWSTTPQYMNLVAVPNFLNRLLDLAEGK